MSKQPIGIFDSGVGGTSIWYEVHKLLPYENTVYLADSKHAPYGTKTPSEIIRLSLKNTELLVQKNCKLIIVACNTATTNAIQTLRKTYNIPIVGIEPALKPAALQTKTKSIGVLATKGTLSSNLFHKTTDLYANNIRVIEQIGEGIVSLIEAGKLHSETMKTLLKSYLNPMLDANIDCLVLGCTHYTYLIPILVKLLPQHIKIIDAGEAVAKQTKAVLTHHKLINTTNDYPSITFYTNANTKELKALINPSNKFKVTYLDF